MLYLLIFPKIYDRFQILQNYTTTAISQSDWTQPPYHTVVGGAIVFQPPCGTVFVNSATVASPTVVSHGGRIQFIFKKSQLFCMNSNGDKIYMKTVAFDDIYNFVVQTC
jgi:hypothetical protein